MKTVSLLQDSWILLGLQCPKNIRHFTSTGITSILFHEPTLYGKYGKFGWVIHNEPKIMNLVQIANKLYLVSLIENKEFQP